MTEKDESLRPCITRRQFITGLGASVIATACSGRSITVFKQDTSTSSLSRIASGSKLAIATAPAGSFASTMDRTLVVVEFGGGNDVLNTVVPHSDGHYFDLRKTLAIKDSIDLDGEVGLNPELGALADQWTAGNLAIVEGVGIEGPDLSHFESMRRWWDGTDKPDHTGWLGRYLDGTSGYDELLAGITLGSNPSQAMLGGGSFVVNIADASGLGGAIPWWIEDREELMAAWAGFAPAGVPIAELTPIQRAISGTVAANTILSEKTGPLEAAIAEGKIAEEESETMASQLRLAATLIASGVNPRVIYIHGYTDFDTHEDQADTHRKMMRDFNAGVSAFTQILADADMSDRALIMTTSEFGRRPKDNDGGTDHGAASSQLLIGPAISGGRYGEPLSLTDLDGDDNMKHNVDFRSVFATVLDGWLETDHADILRGEFEKLPLFRR
ncbi:MAG: DUF1501 domain-containing protein [Granulosicoccus sp.]